MSRRGRVAATALTAIAAAVGVTTPAPAGAATRAVPTEAGSPWPSMRHDRRNTGSSPVRGRYHRGDRPWSFRTAKGVFSTPIVGADETVYAGSADTWFYALGPGGRPRWRYKTGEIIDSAGVLGRPRRRGGPATVTFGSGDEHVYRLSTARRPLSRRARTLWRFRATRRPATGQLVNWWEGNVTMGFGGTLFAGNTGGAEYSLTPGGRLRWLFPAGNSVWSNAAIADDGTVFFGSLDLTVYAVGPRGRLKWSTGTGNFVTSSPAIGRDGTVYIGSFDGGLYALDPDDGAVRWRFEADDHVYASPALGPRLVYIASADGSVYALDRGGRLRWRFDTGEPVRSSPVLGRAPRGNGRIVYVGSSNGSLYALDAESGRRRWSYDTTPRDPVLRDRDDLNSSPALGRRGVYIGGEHGLISHVPYDWCLRRRDPRCNTSPGEAFADELTRMAFVTPGGSTLLAGPRGPLPAATALGTRLVVRRGGETVDAALAAPQVSADPPFGFTTELSGDGHYLHVVPDSFLRPGTRYSLRVGGAWEGEGTSGTAAGTIRFRTAPVLRRGRPLSSGTRRVSAFELRRMAVPLPPILPSLNQIGFDSYDMVVGTLRASRPDAGGEGTLLLWAVSTKPGRGGVPVADRRGAFSFPLAGRYRHDSVMLSQSGLSLTFSFGDVPMRRFDLRMQLDRRLRSRHGAALYAEVYCPEVPVYGPALVAIGLCNDELKLPASGTFITSRYPARGAANERPAGVGVERLTLRRPSASAPGEAMARLSFARGARLPARSHSLGLLLVDEASGTPVPLDYRKALSTRVDGRGNLREVRLRIPAGTAVPQRLAAYVIADVFPLLARPL
jgi:outer membrane protein assembly factor BamB